MNNPRKSYDIVKTITRWQEAEFRSLRSMWNAEQVAKLQTADCFQFRISVQPARAARRALSRVDKGKTAADGKINARFRIGGGILQKKAV